jgi:hypothetical protein
VATASSARTADETRVRKYAPRGGNEHQVIFDILHEITCQKPIQTALSFHLLLDSAIHL